MLFKQLMHKSCQQEEVSEMYRLLVAPPIFDWCYEKNRLAE